MNWLYFTSNIKTDQGSSEQLRPFMKKDFDSSGMHSIFT